MDQYRLDAYNVTSGVRMAEIARRFQIQWLLQSVLIMAVLLGLAGCGDDEPVVQVDYLKRKEITLPVPPTAITYAYLPQYSHSVSYIRHHPLIEYLQQATGLSIRQVFPDTFDDHIKMVRRGEIDISFTNPFVYTSMARTGSTAFARIIEPSGKPYFYSQIICRADNRTIRSLDDVKGKRWIAVDPFSAGGYLFGLGHFLDNGITMQDFAEISFAPGPGGKQEKVVLAVLAGKYDVGTIRDGTLSILEDKIDLEQIRILDRSRMYPGWVFSARSGMDPIVVNSLAQAMFDLSMDNPEDAAILSTAGMQGIIPSTDSDYDPVRELEAKISRALGE